jgi:hypothetical protein
VFTTTLASALNRVVLPLLSKGWASSQVSFAPVVALASTLVGVGLAAATGGRAALSPTNVEPASEQARPKLDASVRRLAATVGMETSQVALADAKR